MSSPDKSKSEDIGQDVSDLEAGNPIDANQRREEQNFRFLLGARAMAAFFIFMYHAWIYHFGIADDSWYARPGVLLSFYGIVCIFFVLSGYHLYRRFARAAFERKPVNIGHYAVRRFARIYPLYLVTTIAALLLFRGAEPGSGIGYPPSDKIWVFFIFGQNSFLDTILRLNVVTWTLCVDVIFYILLPFIGMVAFALRSARGQWLMLAVLALVAFFWRWSLTGASFSLQPGVTGATDPISAIQMPTFLPHFLIGMAVALWVESHRHRTGNWPPAFGAKTTVLLVYGGVLLMLGDPLIEPRRLGLFTNLIVGTGFGLSLLGLVAGTPKVMAWLGSRTMVQVGALSYGIFLWQLPVILFLRQFDFWPSGWLATMLVCFPVTFVLSVLSFRFVEVPARQWLFRRSGMAVDAEREREAAKQYLDGVEGPRPGHDSGHA